MMKFFKMNLLLASLLLLIGCCLLIRVQAEEGDLDVMEPMAGEEQQPRPSSKPLIGAVPLEQPRRSSDYITQYPAPSGVLGGYTPQHVDHQHLQQTTNTHAEEEPESVVIADDTLVIQLWPTTLFGKVTVKFDEEPMQEVEVKAADDGLFSVKLPQGKQPKAVHQVQVALVVATEEEGGNNGGGGGRDSIIVAKEVDAGKMLLLNFGTDEWMQPTRVELDLLRRLDVFGISKKLEQFKQQTIESFKAKFDKALEEVSKMFVTTVSDSHKYSTDSQVKEIAEYFEKVKTQVDDLAKKAHANNAKGLGYVDAFGKSTSTISNNVEAIIDYNAIGEHGLASFKEHEQELLDKTAKEINSKLAKDVEAAMGTVGTIAQEVGAVQQNVATVSQNLLTKSNALEAELTTLENKAKSLTDHVNTVTRPKLKEAYQSAGQLLDQITKEQLPKVKGIPNEVDNLFLQYVGKPVTGDSLNGRVLATAQGLVTVLRFPPFAAQQQQQQHNHREQGSLRAKREAKPPPGYE